MKKNAPQLLLGAHVSIAGGFDEAVTRAESLGCNVVIHCADIQKIFDLCFYLVRQYLLNTLNVQQPMKLKSVLEQF